MHRNFYHLKSSAPNSLPSAIRYHSGAFYFGIGRASSGADLDLYSQDTVGTEPYGYDSSDIFRFSIGSHDLVSALIYLPTGSVAKNEDLNFESLGPHRVAVESQKSILQVSCADFLQINSSLEVFAMFLGGGVRPEKYEIAPGFSFLIDRGGSYCGFSLDSLLQRIVLADGRLVANFPSDDDFEIFCEVNRMLGDEFWGDHEEDEAAKIIASYIKENKIRLTTEPLRDLFGQCLKDMESRITEE